MGLSGTPGLRLWPAFQGPWEAVPERHGRNHVLIFTPNEEGSLGHVLIAQNAVRDEVLCTHDGLSNGRVQVAKLLPLWVLADLPSVQHIKKEAGHCSSAHGPSQAVSRPALATDARSKRRTRLYSSSEFQCELHAHRVKTRCRDAASARQNIRPSLLRDAGWISIKTLKIFFLEKKTSPLLGTSEF